MRRDMFLDLREAPMADLVCGGPRGSKETEEEKTATVLAEGQLRPG